MYNMHRISGAVVHQEFKDEGYPRQAKETLYGTFQNPRENWVTSIQTLAAGDMEGPPGLPYIFIKKWNAVDTTRR